MKKIISTVLCFVLSFSLAACGLQTLFAKNAVLKEPPALNVLCNDASVEALRGTYSWSYDNRDGTSSMIESDSMSPLKHKDHMTPLSLTSGNDSEIAPFTAYLQWDISPDKVSVCCWSEEYWGEYYAEGEDIPVTDIEEGHGTGFSVDLKDGNYIYEVTAEWNKSEKYGGIAHYGFYTVKPDMNLQLSAD